MNEIMNKKGDTMKNTTLDVVIDAIELARKLIENESNEDKYFNTEYGSALQKISDDLFTTRMNLRSTRQRLGF